MLKSFSIALSDNSRGHEKPSRVILSTFSVGLNIKYTEKVYPFTLTSFFSLGMGVSSEVDIRLSRPRRLTK